jgi:signal transduction histidine kinase
MQRARAGSEQMYALIEDLLLISRADSGQWRLNREIISLQDLVVNAVEELELSAIDNQIAISVDVAKNFPPVYADALRIQQVLRNLLSNALRFTPPGGQVALSAHVEPTPRGLLSPSDDEPERVAVLRVKDTGCGIAPDQQARVFERFYQAPNVSGGHSRGQGLGLAIVKMIVEQHGGQILVESVPDKGSTFTCILPCLLS